MTIINKRVTDDGRVKVINDPGRTPSKLNRQWACLEAGLLNKIWKKAGNTVGIIVLIMMCILSAHKILTRDDFGDIEENHLPNNQVNILLAASNQASCPGLLPLSIIDEIYSGNLWFSAKKINDLLNSTTLALDKSLPYLPSSVNYTVYPLEYFVDRQHLSVLNRIYLSNFIDVDHEMAWVDTRNFFYSEPGMGRRIEFDPLLFEESVAEAKESISHEGNSFNLVYYTIVLAENYSFLDLLEELPSDFFPENTYIQSRDTIAVGTEIDTILEYQDIIRELGVIGGILLSIEVAYAAIYCMLKSRQLRTLANYGYCFQSVQKAVLKISNDRKIRYLICQLFAVFVFLYLNSAKASSYSFGNNILVVIVVTVTFLGLRMKKLLIKLMTKSVYSWKYR